jgi:hypothetical protein
MTPDQIALPIRNEQDGDEADLDINPTIESVCAAYVHDDPTSVRWAYFRHLRHAIADILLRTRGILTHGRETYGDGYVLDCEILTTSTGAHKEHWYTLVWDYGDTILITARNANQQKVIPLKLVDINADQFMNSLPKVAEFVTGFLATSLPGATPPVTEVIAGEIAPATGVTHLIKSVDRVPDTAYYAVTTTMNLRIYCAGDSRMFAKAQEGDILALNGHLGKVIPKFDTH